MKGLGAGAFVVAAILAGVGSSFGDTVFHNGGTGACQGCHTTPPALKGSDPGSTCLLCHQAPAGVSFPTGHYVATDARTSQACLQLSPGGDFCWTKKDYRWPLPGSAQAGSSRGERHGHSIVAQDFGYTADGSLLSAPGGSFPSSSLSCISCHDPHGNYRRSADGRISRDGLPIIASGSYSTSPDPGPAGTVGTYRLLAGKGYQPKNLPGILAFTADPPAAVAPPLYNRPEGAGDTRVAYGSGMSEWCQNCHININDSATHLHPVGSRAQLTSSIVSNYNGYVATGKLTGTFATAYTSLVPFEMGTSDYALLKSVASSDGSGLIGPTRSAVVMCLTCHRAHASGWDSMARWNTQAVFLTYNGLYPGIDNGAPAELAQGRLAAETRKTFYDRPVTMFASFQRGLCNKCHVAD
jgi:hypothetical protein